MNWYHLSGQFALAFNSFLSNLCTSRGCLSACHFPKVDGETSLFVEEKKKGFSTVCPELYVHLFC
jgi:hypothetical protein